MKALLATAITLTSTQSVKMSTTQTKIDYNNIKYVTSQEECEVARTPRISYEFDKEYGTCTCWFTTPYTPQQFGCDAGSFINPMHNQGSPNDICLTAFEFEEFKNHDHGLGPDCKPNSGDEIPAGDNETGTDTTGQDISNITPTPTTPTTEEDETPGEVDFNGGDIIPGTIVNPTVTKIPCPTGPFTDIYFDSEICGCVTYEDPKCEQSSVNSGCFITDPLVDINNCICIANADVYLALKL